MAIKQNPVYICDQCGEEMKTPLVQTESVANEGCSTISNKDHTFQVDDGHYCSLACFIDRLKKQLKIRSK